MREGWIKVNFLDSISKVANSTKIPKKNFLQEGIYPIVSQEDASINGYWNEKKDIFKVNKPIIIFGDHTKKIKYIDFDFILGADGVKILLPNEKLNSRFFYYQLKSLNIRDLGYARHYRLLKEFKIQIPPLPEQTQIVKTLDNAFAQIDQAKANLEKNLANAKELFQSKLNEVFSQMSESKKLGKLLDLLTDYHANGSYKVLKKNVELKDEEDYAWMVRSTDFEKKFKNDFKYINEHAYNHLAKSKIFGGEIIISKIGNAGKVYLMPKIDKPCSLAMNLFLLRLDDKLMISEYLYFYFQSTKGKIQILSKLNGATTKTITKDSVRDLNIPFIEVEFQTKIVKEFNILENKIIEFQTHYQQKLNNLEELKKSILEKAFRGEL